MMVMMMVIVGGDVEMGWLWGCVWRLCWEDKGCGS